MSKQILTCEAIDAFEGLQKTHFLNTNAKRLNKSLGDLTGLKNLGVHWVEVAPGCASTERHVHHFEDECVYILEGSGSVTLGDESFAVKAGDFIAHPAGTAPHCMRNDGAGPLRYLLIGQRLDHEVVDYPDHQKRLYYHQGHRDVVDAVAISHPELGRKI